MRLNSAVRIRMRLNSAVRKRIWLALLENVVVFFTYEEFENFVTAFMKAKSAECVPTKPKAKCWFLCDSLVVRGKNNLTWK